MKLLVVHHGLRPALAAATVAATAACGSNTEPPPDFTCDPGIVAPAVVTFAWDSRPDTMRVLVNDAETVATACAFLETQSGAKIPSGPIAKGAGIDTRIPFHWIADSVRIVEIAIELCDGALMKTTAEVDQYFQGATGDANSPRAPYCPWGAYPVKVESPSP